MSHHDKVEFLGSGKITIPGPNKVTILGPDNVTILRKFLPYLRLIRALNLENFHRNRDGLQNFLPTFYAIAMIGSMSIGTILMICNLFESDGDTKVFVVSIPMLMSLILVHVLFVALIWKNETTAEAIKRMQKLVSYRSNESQQSHQIYEQAERFHSFFSTTVEMLMMGAFSVIVLAPAMMPITYASFGYPPPQLWTLPLQIHSMLGQTTYMGFFIDWLIVATAVSAGLIAITATGSIYFGMFCYIDGMVKDVRSRLIGPEVAGVHQFSDEVKSWSLFVREIEFHVEISGAANSLYLMMDVIIFFITLTCTVVIAFNLSVLELTDTIDLVTIMAFIDMSNTVVMTFAYCYLSEWITSDLLMVGDIFYDSPWYRLPAKQQRFLTFPIQRAQREFHLKGLGLFECSLFVFSTIIRTAASYFIMIRKFN